MGQVDDEEMPSELPHIDISFFLGGLNEESNSSALNTHGEGWGAFDANSPRGNG